MTCYGIKQKWGRRQCCPHGWNRQSCGPNPRPPWTSCRTVMQGWTANTSATLCVSRSPTTPCEYTRFTGWLIRDKRFIAFYCAVGTTYATKPIKIYFSSYSLNKISRLQSSRSWSIEKLRILVISIHFCWIVPFQVFFGPRVPGWEQWLGPPRQTSLSWLQMLPQRGDRGDGRDVTLVTWSKGSWTGLPWSNLTCASILLEDSPNAISAVGDGVGLCLPSCNLDVTWSKGRTKRIICPLFRSVSKPKSVLASGDQTYLWRWYAAINKNEISCSWGFMSNVDLNVRAHQSLGNNIRTIILLWEGS